MVRAIAVAALVMLCTAAQAETVEEKAAICGACHGEKGAPVESTIPVIWGQNAGYLYLQMRDFQKGKRKDDRMSAVAANVVKEDALALAEYFSQKPWPNLAQPSASKADAAIAVRVNKSIGCTGCHLEQYQGDTSVPRTAGQSHDYLAKTLADFRSGARGNNPGMTDLMKAATPDELTAMANYLAGF